MKLQTKIINKFGKMAGWNSISATMLGRTLEGITQLAYGDSQEVENVYGRGGILSDVPPETTHRLPALPS